MSRHTEWSGWNWNFKNMLSPCLQTSLTVQQYNKSFNPLCEHLSKNDDKEKNKPFALNIKSEITLVTKTMFKVCVEWLFWLLCPLNLLNLKPHLPYNQNKLSLFFWFNTNNYTQQDNDSAWHRTGHTISGSDIHLDLNVFLDPFHQRDNESKK